MLEKVVPVIFDAYILYFDEMFDIIIDEILEEEVIYFNKKGNFFKLN